MSYYILKDFLTSDISVSAYLLDRSTIRFIFFTPLNKYQSLGIRWQYRYIINDESSFSNAHLQASTNTFDIWDAILNVTKIDINFVIRGGGDNYYKWFSEIGKHNVLEDALPFSFIIPMISKCAVYRYLPTLPQWLPGNTIYEIFVDRFRKHKESEGCLPWNVRPPQNDFFHLAKFGGTLQGIIHSIIFDGCYLKELGIGSIYMTPIFESPSNHKYNATNYYEIDKSFGGEDDLKNLTEEAKKNGIHVILDGVFNHCSDTLKIKCSNGEFIDLFTDLRANGVNSRYANWVEWEDDSHWRGFAHLEHMPILNTEDEECANYLIDVVGYWTRNFNIDGWRLDVANEIGTKFIRKLRESLSDTSSDVWLLGEILHNGNNWIAHDKLSGITNHHWRECVINYLLGEWTSDIFDDNLQVLWRRYPSTIYPGVVNYLNNHDTQRILTCLNKKYDYDTSVKYNIIAAILLFTAIGCPMVFYGEEIGMEGEGDPDCRKCMEWDLSLWDQHKIEKRLMLKEIYTKLIHFRKQNPWLSDGAWETIIKGKNSLYVYKRIDCASSVFSDNKGKELLVLINTGDEDLCIDIIDDLDFKRYLNVLKNQEVPFSNFSNYTLTAYSGEIIISC